MANTVYNFAALNGQTVLFDAATDTLAFDASFTASAMRLVQGTSGNLSTVAVTIGNITVVLQGVSIDRLRSGGFSFADGSAAIVGDGLATSSADGSANTISGGTGNDYLSGLAGNDSIVAGAGNDRILTGSGTDTVIAGEGQDTMEAEGTLAAASRFDGGTGYDELRLDGNYAGGVTFVDGTVKNIERIVLAGDNNAAALRTYKLTTHDTTVADGATLNVDGTALEWGDNLNFDGSAELTGRFELLGGAGADSLKGGAGSDMLVGGAGADFISGGQGADTLIGGADDDIFSFARGSTRSDSSPTSADRITDFQGAGVAGGDRIDLPVPSGGKQLAFAGYRAFAAGAPNAHDGFADVYYEHLNGQTRIAVDVDDNGILSEVDQVIVLDGIHTIQAEDFSDNFTVVRGTEGADTIIASGAAETIYAQGGADSVSGNGGNDTVFGGVGADTLDGGTGNDTLNGEADNDVIRGGDGSDALDGGDGSDLLQGDASGDNLKGGLGTDTLEGGTGNDTMDGEAGNDTLHGGAENDTMNGGLDNDVLNGDSGNDSLAGGAGNDTLDGGADNDSLTGGIGADSLFGGSGNDTLNGDDSSGDSTADTLNGGDGDDWLHAGTGRDVLTGGLGADRFVVTSAASSAAHPNRITDLNLAAGDLLQLQISGSSPKPLAWYGQKSFFFDGTFGNSGVQFPLAGDGLADAIWDYDAATNTTRLAVDVNDDGVFSTGDLLVYLTGQHNLSFSNFADTFSVIRGGAGDDVMPGTANADTYYGMGGNDTLNGEGGSDTLYGGDGNDSVNGGLAADLLYGDAGDDLIHGGAGAFNDTLHGGTGNDTMDGGEGDDNLSGNENADSLSGGLGNDTLQGGTGADTLLGNDGNDNMAGNEDADRLDGGIGNDSMTGGAGADSLVGGEGNDSLSGGADVDTILGGTGNDTIDGDDGADLIDAGADSDLIYVGGGDTVTGGLGADQFTANVNLQLSSFANQARIADFQKGTDKLHITWSNTAKTLVFNAGDKALGALSTAAGSQTVLGNAGDTLHDVFYSTSADGQTTHIIVDTNDDGKLDANDIVLAFNGDIDFDLADFIAGTFNVQRGSDAAETITGGAGNDTIYGVGGNDSMAGLDGADYLYGQDGDDTIDGGVGGDALYGDAGNDVVLGGAGLFNDSLFGGTGNDTLDGGDGGDYLAGNENADSLIGGLGNDSLHGGSGIDTLLGGEGNDGLYGNEDADQLDGGVGNDTLQGGTGTDSLIGGDGADDMSGGSDNDTLNGGIGNDTLNGDDGADVVDGGADSDLIYAGGGDTITGGLGTDQFTFNVNTQVSTLASQARVTDFQQAADKILLTWSNTAKTFVFNGGDKALGVLSTAIGSQTQLGNAGDSLHDVFYSTSADGLTTHLIVDLNDDGKLDANDLVIAFNGDKDFSVSDFVAGTFTVLRGSDGADTINGGIGNDTIYGVGGNDQIGGFEGSDYLYGQAGDDTLNGGLGGDALYGEAGNDSILGGTGQFNDSLFGGTGLDTMDGGDGSDYLHGNEDADSLTGGLGNDTLSGGTGIDTLFGGEGDDNLSGNEDADQIDGGIGNDYIYGGTGADQINGGLDNDNISGGGDNDTILGGDGKDTIDGDDGADLIDAGAGDDMVNVGARDTVTGGLGFDQFTLNASSGVSNLANQARIADFQQGVDKLYLTWSSTQRLFALNSSPQSLNLVIGESLPFGGDAFSDIVFSHVIGANGPVTRVVVDVNDDGKLDANDMVFELAGTINLTAADFTASTFSAVRGTPGNDSVVGTTGSDTLYGVAGNDSIQGSAGTDSLYGQTGDDTLDGGSDNDTIYGGDGQDLVLGGAGSDQLNGDAGNDTLEGAENDDTINGGEGTDQLRGGFGADTLYGGAGNDTLEGGADSDGLNGGTENDLLMGQDGNDVLKGDAGDDTLQGGSLSDTLTGGAGNDTLDGGTEIDTAVFSGNMSEYEIVAQNGGVVVKHLKTTNSDGVDFLTNVERLQFADQTTNGNFLTVSDSAIAEGDAGTKKLIFTVSLFAPATGPVSVNYSTTNGTAAAGSDFTAATGTLNFAIGETSKQVEITITGDLANEIDETLNLTLSNASGAAIGDATGVGTILNDDATVSIADAQILEGNSGIKTLSFTISLDKPAAGPISVSYQTADVTALAGSDYEAKSGFVQFAAGEQSKTVTITISGDVAGELDESFVVNLLSASGAKIGDGSATGTILNDDNRVPVAVSDGGAVIEAGSGGPGTSSASGNALANDSDLDTAAGDAIQVNGIRTGAADAGGALTAVAGATVINGVYGQLTINPNGSYSYALDNDRPSTQALAAGQTVTDAFTYRITDSRGATATAEINISVSGATDAGDPVLSAAADTLLVTKGLVSTISASALLANDSSTVAGESLTVTSVANAVGGTVQLVNGQLIINASGPASFEYTVTNAAGATATSTVTVNTVVTGTLADVIAVASGTAGSNVQGQAGNDSLTGSSGMDRLDGGAGNDTMRGGTGADIYVVDSAYDMIGESGPAGEIDTVETKLSAYTLGANLENLVLVGTAKGGTGNAENNVITGTSAVNDLKGMAGNDTLLGDAGNDTLSGGEGDDSINGGADIDTVSYLGTLGGVNVDLSLTGSQNTGGAGVDTIVDVENLIGTASNDTLGGNGGDNILDGGLGNDTVSYANAAAGVTVSLALTTAQATGGAGTDTLKGFENLTGSAHADRLTGGTVANLLSGLGGNDSIYGGAGNDTIDGGTGNDRMEGQAGNDVYIVDSLADEVIEAAVASEIDEIRTSLAAYTLKANTEILSYTGSANFDGTGTALKDILNGGIGNDTLKGMAGDDKLFGNGGNDTLVGGDGKDTLDGGDGTNMLDGGTGDDTYEIHSASAVNTIFEAAGAAGGLKDTVRTSLASFTLAANVEALVYTGAGAFTGIGNDGANSITGGGGSDSLSGGIGLDTLDGGLGDDIMVGGADSDTYVVDSLGDVTLEDVGGGLLDTVKTSLSSYTLHANVENLLYTGTGNFTGNGNAEKNAITGGIGNDTLDGGANSDNLKGGLGNDSLIGGEGIDMLDGGAGADTMDGGIGGDTFIVDDIGDVIIESLLSTGGIDTVKTGFTSYTLQEGVEKLTFTGAGAAGHGNSAANTLTGFNGNDTLWGEGGNDSLIGGSGDDFLYGGSGLDQLTGGLGADRFVLDRPSGGSFDKITDFSAAQFDKLGIRGSDYGLAAGALDPSLFSGTGAATAAHGQFVYNSVTKTLYWDADGTGAGAAVSIANFATSVTLGAGDFVIM
jgi:VCBS repeat-containing protein